MSSPSNLAGTGLEVIDLQTDPEFTARRLHTRDIATQMDGMARLASAFVERPETLLQELVESAIDLCGADSAGISLQSLDKQGEATYHWVATAGKYAHFLNAALPAFPSACAVCIERDQPQLFRVTQEFFDLMGIQADTVTDGLLIPWTMNDTRGTIWIMAHGRREAFDAEDSRMMETLANFAAMAVRQQLQQKLIIEQAQAKAAAAMANDLAHKINNPLQSLTNCVYMAAEGVEGTDTQTLARHMSSDLKRLSSLTKQLLELPIDAVRRTSTD
ncbi:MAG TPA: GAF domain-containing protein [Acidobacteriaceae bacterium]|nr:GAF domain-containing protein [Acidobacteriaceae bacterium]